MYRKLAIRNIIVESLAIYKKFLLDLSYGECVVILITSSGA